MEFKANRDSHCFDCGKEYNEGTMLYANGHKTKAGKDYFCPDGTNCQGAMEFSSPPRTAGDPPQQSIPQIPKQTIEELNKRFVDTVSEEERLYNAVYKVIGDYILVRQKCEKLGIYEGAVIGMILNNVIRNRLC